MLQSVANLIDLLEEYPSSKNPVKLGDVSVEFKAQTDDAIKAFNSLRETYKKLGDSIVKGFSVSASLIK